MQADNAARAAIGAGPYYTEQNFLDLINKYGIHWNAVVEGLRP